MRGIPKEIPKESYGCLQRKGKVEGNGGSQRWIYQCIKCGKQHTLTTAGLKYRQKEGRMCQCEGLGRRHSHEKRNQIEGVMIMLMLRLAKIEWKKRGINARANIDLKKFKESFWDFKSKYVLKVV